MHRIYTFEFFSYDIHDIDILWYWMYGTCCMKNYKEIFINHKISSYRICSYKYCRIRLRVYELTRTLAYSERLTCKITDLKRNA